MTDVEALRTKSVVIFLHYRGRVLHVPGNIWSAGDKVSYPTRMVLPRLLGLSTLSRCICFLMPYMNLSNLGLSQMQPVSLLTNLPRT